MCFLQQYWLRLLLCCCFAECLPQQRITPEIAVNFRILDTPIVVLRGHKKSIHSVALSANQKIVAASSYDGHIRLWSCRNGDTLFHRKQHVLATLVLSGDGQYLGVCSRVGVEYRIQLLSDNQLKWEYDHAEPDVQQFGSLFSISADGKTMAFCVRRKSKLKLFDLETGRSNGEITVEGSINAFAFARATGTIAIAYTSDDSEGKDRLGKSVVGLWDVKNVKQSKIISQRRSKTLHTVMKFSADDKMLAEVWNDEEVVQTDIGSGKITGRYHNKDVITEDVARLAAFAERGKRERSRCMECWNATADI
jgi:WD40 repeat protein